MILFQKLSKKKNKQEETDSRGLISSLYRNGLLEGLVEEYLESCRDSGEAEGKSRRTMRFANLAGFCRFLGTGLADLEQLRGEFPEEYDRLLAVFEDEALNSCISPTLLSAYVKKRIRYSCEEEKPFGRKEVSYRFEHDIFTDGE